LPCYNTTATMTSVINLKKHDRPLSSEKATPPLAPDQKKSERENFYRPILWEAEEYPYYRKSSDWYWAVGIITAGFFAVAIIVGNLLFGAFILLGGFTLALYGARRPQTVSFSISPKGVHVGDTIYPYESIKSFWIFYDPPHVKELSIESHKFIMPHIRIPLGNVNPANMRSYLQQFLPEEQQEEALTDSLARYFRF